MKGPEQVLPRVLSAVPRAEGEGGGPLVVVLGGVVLAPFHQHDPEVAVGVLPLVPGSRRRCRPASAIVRARVLS